MEFPEKLQQLRKRHALTQEQLAEKLFVSRTAVSKWESGKGYPNIDSLKAIAAVFSVSLDDLLSDGELQEIAKAEEEKSRAKKRAYLVFAMMDLLVGLALVLPLFPRQLDGVIRPVSLFASPDLTAWQFVMFPAVLVVSVLAGLADLVPVMGDGKMRLALTVFSASWHIAAIILFALARQPYATVWLFILLVGKGIVFLRDMR